jgi:hypothetical protein
MSPTECIGTPMLARVVLTSSPGCTISLGNASGVNNLCQGGEESRRPVAVVAREVTTCVVKEIAYTLSHFVCPFLIFYNHYSKNGCCCQAKKRSNIKELEDIFQPLDIIQ